MAAPITVIDFQSLDGRNHLDTLRTLEQACEADGFLQVRENKIPSH